MFDENISGELPEHIEFIHKTKKVFEEWGYTVLILHSDCTYMDCFNTVIKKSRVPDRIGKKYGFPLAGRCAINSRCKIKPIKNFYKKLSEDYICYVGLAVDEKQRINRMKTKKNNISLLEKYGYTEKMAYQLCKKYDLLSPVYSYTKRGGCWFCMNCSINQLRNLRNNHRQLWEKLLNLEFCPCAAAPIWNILRNKSIHDYDNFFEMEDRQIKLL